MEKLYFTKKGYVSLRQKGLEMEKKLSELQAQTAHVADVGGNQYHDNSSYEMLIIDIRAADFQLKQIRNILNKAVVVELPRDNSFVTLGTRVTCLVNGETRVYTVVGYEESNPRKNRIAYNTPLAKLMLRCAVGDEIEGSISGRIVCIEILKIEVSEEEGDA